MRSCDRNNSRFQPDNRFSIANAGELLPEQTQIITIYNCSTKHIWNYGELKMQKSTPVRDLMLPIFAHDVPR